MLETQLENRIDKRLMQLSTNMHIYRIVKIAGRECGGGTQTDREKDGISNNSTDYCNTFLYPSL